jgi:hypothetical protein
VKERRGFRKEEGEGKKRILEGGGEGKKRILEGGGEGKKWNHIQGYLTRKDCSSSHE